MEMTSYLHERNEHSRSAEAQADGWQNHDYGSSNTGTEHGDGINPAAEQQ